MSKPIEHAYVIRAIENEIEFFDLTESEVDEISYVANWHDDRITTLYGNFTWCENYFKKNYKQYNFYDLDFQLANIIIQNKPVDFYEFYEIEEFVLMMRTKHEKPNFLKTLETDNLKINKIILKDTDLKFELVEEPLALIGSVNIEKINADVFVLSKLFINVEKRNKGYGTYLLYRVLKQYKNKTILLYVKKDNNVAINIYSRLGFKIVKRLLNFELKNKSE